MPPAPDPGDTTTEPQPPPTDGPGVPPVIEPPVDEDEPEDPGAEDPEDPGAEDPGAEDPVDPNQPPTITIGGDENIFSKANKTVEREGWATNISPGAPSEADQTLTVTLSVDNTELFDELPTLDLDTGTLRYVPTPSSQGVAQVTLTLQDDGGTEDGGQDTTVKTFNIQITNPNSPIIYLDGGNELVDVSVDYRFNQREADDTPILPAIPLGAVDGDGNSLIEIAYGDEADPGDKEISQVIIRVNHEAGDSQELTIPTGGPNQIDISSDIEGGFKTWTLTPSDGTDSLALTSWNPFLQALVYEKSSWDQDANPGDLTPRTLTFEATDADGNESLVATKTINPVSINEPPSITLDENVTTINAVKDVPFSLADVIDGFADPDAGSKDLTLTLSVNIGEIDLSGVSDLTVEGNDKGQTVTVRGSQTNLTSQLNNFSYKSNTEGNVTLTIELNDNGNTGFEPEEDGSFSAAAANEVSKTVSITVTDEPVVAEDVEMKISVQPAGGPGLDSDPNGLSEYPVGDQRFIDIPASAFLLDDSGQNISMTAIFAEGDEDGAPPNGITKPPGENVIRFDMQVLHENTGEDKFDYRIEGLGGQDVATVTITYLRSANSNNIERTEGSQRGPNILNGWRANTETGVGDSDILIGGDADDFLIGGRRQNILYGGQGNDTLAGIWLQDDVENTGRNQSNKFVFDRSDFLPGTGFDATNIQAIRDYSHYNTIMTFNWGEHKEWKNGPLGNEKDQDVIQLSNFRVDKNNPDSDILNMINVRTDIISSGDLDGNILTGDQRIFAVQDLAGDEEAMYILYDASGDNTQNMDTYIIAKLSTAWAGDEVLLAPGNHLTDFDLSFDTFDPNP
ncbi:hypothetical protein E1H12_16930 [Geitlerinema sp. P-1104]|nr:hypothetical protein [Geitlerinema sp. P-1104]